MAVSCASRFAVLKLEDDDLNEDITKKPMNSTNPNLTNKNKTGSKSGTNETKSKSKKKKKTSDNAELQSLAFSTHKSKQKSTASNAKIISASQKQWEEWKLKDSELVSENYEQDLQEALLLSKIDYEEKKEMYDNNQKESEQSKNASKKKKKNNQKKDKGVMSLDEFQNMDSYQTCSNSHQKLADLDDFEISKPIVDESNFFDKIEEDAEKIINKEHKQEQYKNLDPVVESARLLQYQEDMRKKDEEIATLTKLVEKFKEELKSVKSRNKKLYQILESGEMREKAEILFQIDHLTNIKDELTEQLSDYHTSLEQERSKVHSLQMELKKYQNNKKLRTDSK